MNKYLRWSLTVAGIAAGVVALSWLYTTWAIADARSKGEYVSAEAGMLALMDKYYPPDHKVEILYAGPNSRDGSKPYVWYVIAEVRASARADGSEMGRNGCDNPGTFFLQTKEGSWVHVPEGFFTLFMTSWMEAFDLAGEGQSTPSTDLIQHQPRQFCVD
ncbi:MAG: hypothetical protein L6Q26_08445 [Anaerolineales bacterium]|nr:hypothetical protein [Anaerolineales bacterium]NUQ84792.1 hypothetical protein [Anaerolineales bacterium]